MGARSKRATTTNSRASCKTPAGTTTSWASACCPTWRFSGRLAANDLHSNCFTQNCGVRDLSASAKGGIGLDAAGRFRIAAGATDIGGAVTYFRTYYGVLTYNEGPVEVSAGLAKRSGEGINNSRSPLDGPFAAAAWTPLPWIRGHLEYSDGEAWAGVRLFAPKEWVPEGWTAYVGANQRLTDTPLTQKSWFTAGISIPLYKVPDLPGNRAKAPLPPLSGTQLPAPVYEARTPAPAATPETGATAPAAAPAARSSCSHTRATGRGGSRTASQGAGRHLGRRHARWLGRFARQQRQLQLELRRRGGRGAWGHCSHPGQQPCRLPPDSDAAPGAVGRRNRPGQLPARMDCQCGRHLHRRRTVHSGHGCAGALAPGRRVAGKQAATQLDDLAGAPEPDRANERRFGSGRRWTTRSASTRASNCHCGAALSSNGGATSP